MNVELVNNSVQHNLMIGFDTGFKVPEISYDLHKLNPTEWDIFDVFALRKIEAPSFTMSAYYDGEFRFNTIILTDSWLHNKSRGTVLPSNLALMFNNREGLGLKSFGKLKHNLLKNESFEGFINITVKYFEDEMYFNGVGFSMPPQFVSMRNLLLGDTNINFVASLKTFEYPQQEAETVFGLGKKINTAWDDLYKQIELLPSNIYYRTDGLTATRKMFDSFRRNKLF
jgi:hypothetical protein